MPRDPAEGAPPRSLVPIFVTGMLISGCANSLLTKYQDMQCVQDCSSSLTAVYYEQPVWQSLNMFIGEMFCLLPLGWRYVVARRQGYAARMADDRNSKRDVGNSSMFTLATQRASEESQLLSPTSEDEEDVFPSSPDLTLSAAAEPLPPLSIRSSTWLILPAILDILGTTLMNVGLILCPVSIYQMSRGALVMWVGVLSVLFLRRRLFGHQWTALGCVMLGVGIVGLSGSLVKKSIAGGDALSAVMMEEKGSRESPAAVAVGVLLILGAQCFTASQFVLEEKIMTWYTVPPLQAVGLEGLFGFLTILISMPFLHFFLSTTSPYFDIPRGFHQTIDHPRVLGLSVAICFSIATFNVCGLSVTRAVSAAARSTVDTSRTLGIWAVSLLLGWEHLVWPFSLLQIVGFSLLVYGTFVFNGLMRPFFGPRPVEQGIQLPEEDPRLPDGEEPDRFARPAVATSETPAGSSFVRRPAKQTALQPQKDGSVQTPEIATPSTTSSTGSSFVRRTTATHPRPPPGTIPSPSNPHLPLLSTGIPSLDDVLGSGQPLGSIFSVLAPDEHSGWGKLIERYWIAQGLASGHDVVLVGGGTDVEDAEEELRGIVKGCMWIDEGSMANKVGSGRANEDPDSDAEGLEPDSGNKTRIAWRYEKMKRFQTTVGNQSNGNQATSSFSHTLNLTTPIPTALIAHLEQTQQLSYISLSSSASSHSNPGNSTATSSAYAPFQSALEAIRRTLIEKGVYDERSPISPGQKGSVRGKAASGKVVRVVIHDLGGLEWGDRVAGPHIHRFLHSLRQLTRHSTAAVLCTYPAALASTPPVPVASSNMIPSPVSCNPSHWLDSILHASDACITLQGFASSPSLDLSFPLSHGLVHIHTLPQLHSSAPGAYKHSTLLGLAAGSGSSGQNNLAFRLKRKRFVIETLHLGVEGGVGERRTEPSSTGGAVASKGSNSTSGHEGHAHSHDHSHSHSHSHSHEENAKASAGLRVEHEGIDDSGRIRKAGKSVGFRETAVAGYDVDSAPPLEKQERKRVAFVQHDKPELYDF